MEIDTGLYDTRAGEICHFQLELINYRYHTIMWWERTQFSNSCGNTSLQNVSVENLQFEVAHLATRRILKASPLHNFSPSDECGIINNEQNMKHIKSHQYFQLLKHNNDFILGPRTFLRNASTDLCKTIWCSAVCLGINLGSKHWGVVFCQRN